MRRRLLLAALALFPAALSSRLQAEEVPPPPHYSTKDIGIFVDTPLVYNNKALQQQLQTLASRLGQISGVDQTSILSHIGAIQGASSSSFSASVQLMGPSLPGTVNTAAQPTGQTVTTAAQPVTNTVTTNPYFPTTVTAAPAGTAPYSTTQTVTTANGATQQTVTTSTNATNQTVTTTPALTPALPALPSASGFAAPTGFSVSALSALNEEMQLSYELSSQILLLGGSESSDITPDGQAKRTVTLGFPISIRPPDQYKGYAATIEVTACLKSPSSEQAAPILKTILPREKTYNVAGLTNNQASFGAGGILGNVISIGGALGFGKQTYYLVQDQDTVAFQKAVSTVPKLCAGKEASALRFGWSIKPVLGQKSIAAGLRQTYAQISFAPGPDPKPAIYADILFCWSRYNSGTGAIEKPETKDCKLVPRTIPFNFQTAAIGDVTVADRGQGLLDVGVIGAFGAGSRIEIGSASYTDGSAGFENLDSGLRLRFPAQTLATGDAWIIAPDGNTVSLVTSDARTPIQSKLVEVNADWAKGTGFTPLPCGPTDIAPDAPPPKNACVNRIWFLGGLPPGAAFATASSFTLYPVATPDNAPGIAAYTFDANLAKDLAKVQIRAGSHTCNLTSPDPVAPLGLTNVKWLNPTQVRVTLSLPWCASLYTRRFPLYAVAGGQVYGFSDAPFEGLRDDEVTLVLPASLFTHDFKIHVGQLFLPPAYAQDFWAPRLTVPTITGIQTVSADKTNPQVLLAGFNLSKLSPTQAGVTLLGKPADTSLSLKLTANAAQSLKLLLLSGENDLLITAALPDDLVKASGSNSSSKAVSLKKPTASIPLNSTNAITINGSNLDQIIAIRYNGVRVAFTLDPKGKFLTISHPPPGFTSTLNVAELEIDAADGTKQNYGLTISGS